jgi:uncharacterized membrane protein AbrB (regulator of aidB expression)
MLYPITVTVVILITLGIIVYAVRVPLAYIFGALVSHVRRIKREIQEAFREGRGKEPK